MARRRRTILVVVCLSLVAWLIWTSLSASNDGKSRLSTPDYFSNTRRFPLPQPESSRTNSNRAPPIPADKSLYRALQDRYYEGAIQLYSLSYTLQAAAAKGGLRDQNDNVVFVAADGASIASLLPIACEMTGPRRVRVHFVFLARTNKPILDILRANGIDDDCHAFWHDARPDFVTYSTDRRMEVASDAVMKHVQEFIHPQVIFADQSGAEEPWLLRSATKRTAEFGIPFIALPAYADTSLRWLTRLDAGTLRAWNQDSIHILIHSPPKASGSLQRLLISLREADYTGHTHPQLTIELPSSQDPMLASFLRTFRWPPGASAGHDRAFSVRRRVQPLDADAPSTARFVESFFGADPQNTHVLMFSPNAEVSPTYFHALRYLLLNYRHASTNLGERDTALFGISLATPGNATAAAKLAAERRKERREARIFDDASIFLLSQQPDTSAALYFGEFWAEFHDFLTRRLRLSQDELKTPIDGAPLWVSYLQELIRARGYLMLHPGLADSQGDALVKIHDELAPYELGQSEIGHKKEQHGTKLKDLKLVQDQPIVISDPANYDLKSEVQLSTLKNLIDQLLPDDGDLPELDALPVLDYTGDEIAKLTLEKQSVDFAKDFAKTIGRCSGEELNGAPSQGVDDLSCAENARRGKRRNG